MVICVRGQMVTADKSNSSADAAKSDDVINLTSSESQDEVLAALRYGDLKVTGRLVAASNATLFCEVNVGAHTFNAIYKPETGERPLWDFPDGTLANREFAAYLISEASNLHCVPPTLLRDGPFGFGMVQLWIDIDESIDLVDLYPQDLPKLRELALFDVIINNTDRKIGHLLPTTGGQIFGVDHGVTFHSEDKLRTVLWQWESLELTSSELTLLTNLAAKLDPARVEAESNLLPELQDLLTQIEISALRSRIDRLIRSKCFPSPSPDWPAVPWPPF